MSKILHRFFYVLISGEAPAGNATPNERRGVHATISLSGFLSLIKRNANPNKETKSTA